MNYIHNKGMLFLSLLRMGFNKIIDTNRWHQIILKNDFGVTIYIDLQKSTYTFSFIYGTWKGCSELKRDLKEVMSMENFSGCQVLQNEQSFLN